MVDNVIEPTYRRFHDSADAQVIAVTDYCTGLGEANDAELKISCADCMESGNGRWQKVEMLQFTPLTDNESNLRNAIYSWPLQSSCASTKIPYVLWATIASIFRLARSNARDLMLLNIYCLHSRLEHACSTGIGVEGWSNLTEQEITAARCSYATLAANDIAASADILVSSWSADSITDNGKYLKAVGDGQVHDALNAITDTLFYFDTNTKSDKVAVPLGVKLNNCGSGLVVP